MVFFDSPVFTASMLNGTDNNGTGPFSHGSYSNNPSHQKGPRIENPVDSGIHHFNQTPYIRIVCIVSNHQAKTVYTTGYTLRYGRYE